MQDTQTDPDNCRRLGVDERYIKFRPSPNFKNMKKFLKSKIDNSESSSQSPPNGSCDQTTPNTASESPPRNNQPMEKENPSPAKQVVHPPLPLEPPPPDKLPVMPVPIKNEIIDNEYQDEETSQESPNLSTADKTEEASLRLSFEQNGEESGSTSTEKPKEICRDFIRGTCVRVGCRFAHQCDVNQLFGVYTFCRNFQNAVCTRPQCKYVHASVFEEQEFYRTGVLPPHTQYHIKKPYYMLPPPPPPPPPPPVEETQSPPCTPDALNTVGLQRTNTTDKPLISCVPVSKLESKPAENDFRHMLQEITSPLKSWNPIDPFSPPAQPRDLDKQQCKKCDNSEFRLQFNKEKFERMENASKELKMKSQLLTKKSQSLFTTLITIIKEKAATVNGNSQLRLVLNTFGEKEKEVLWHILENSTHLNNT